MERFTKITGILPLSAGQYSAQSYENAMDLIEQYVPNATVENFKYHRDVQMVTVYPNKPHVGSSKYYLEYEVIVPVIYPLKGEEGNG